MKFGNRLVELREKRNLSQEELADKLHVSRQTVSNWENDKVSIDVDKAAEICRFFGVDMNYLFMESGNESLREDTVFNTSQLDAQNRATGYTRSQSPTKIWLTAIIISVVMCVVFTVFETVVLLRGDIGNAATVLTSTLLLCAVIFGGLALLMSLFMLVLSAVMYRRSKQKDSAETNCDGTKQ